MNLNLPTLSKPIDCCPTKSLSSLAPAAKPELSAATIKPIDFGPIFDGGELPGGCFACGLAFTSNFGEQFLGQFFGL